MAVLAIATGTAGATALLRNKAEAGLLVCIALGVITHAVLTGALAPRLSALWTSDRAAKALARDHLDPRNGVTTGPPVAVGYAEPSLVFALGTGTELDNPADGADSVADGQPAIVEKRQDPAFRAALAAEKVAARPVEDIKGFDYSIGKTRRPDHLEIPGAAACFRRRPRYAAGRRRGSRPTLRQDRQTQGSEIQGCKTMSRFIEIVEVGPRDGLQNEAAILEVEDKLAFITRLRPPA